MLSQSSSALPPAQIITGILPILSVPQIRRFAKLCGSTIPHQVEKQLSKYENDEEGAAQYGIELATQLCEGVLKFGVPGFHFYTLNRAPSTEAILKNLNLI